VAEGMSTGSLRRLATEKLLARASKHEEEQDHDHNSQKNATRDHDLIDLIVLLRETAAFGIETGAARTLFQFGEADAALHHHGLT
jgi:hypothetical protein